MEIPEYKHSISKRQIKGLLNKEDPIIIEIGAHYGEDTVGLVKEFEDPKVYSFEPDPRNIEIIKKYLNTDKFHLIEMAVSNENNNEADFYLSYKKDFNKNYMLNKYKWIKEEDYIGKNINRSGASSLNPGLDTVMGVCKVKTTTLDAWAEKNKIEEIDFIWMDVQGGEKKVIDGAINIFKNTKFCYMEYGETFYDGGMSRKETIQEMLDLGFEVINKYSDQGGKGNLLFKNSKKGKES